MKLDDTNFEIYAARNYDNPQCYDTEEFRDDLKRFKYIKRLLIKYHETGEFKDRLVLNHLTIIFNVFGTAPGIRMLFLKLPNFYPELKTILSWMKILPTMVEEIGPDAINIPTDAIAYDYAIKEILTKIVK